MGNSESNFDIKYKRLSNYQIQAKIKHLKVKHKEIILESDSDEEIVKLVNKEIATLNEVYDFNNNQQKKINSVLGYIGKEEVPFDWDLVEKEKMISFKLPRIEYIQYNQISGKPEAYFPIDNPSKSTVEIPNKPTPPKILKNFLSEWRQKNYEKKREVYEENSTRVLTLSKEQKKWKEEYPKTIKKLKEHYSQGDTNAIEIYSKLLLDNLNFNISFETKYSFEYNLENKYLIVDYSITNAQEIFELLKDKVYEKTYPILKQVEDIEVIERLSHIWYQIILKVIYVLHKRDEKNFIESIHFNGKILTNNKIFKFGTEKYKTQIIVSKEQFTDTFLKDKKIFTSHYIEEFNRDFYFIEKLQREGIYIDKRRVRKSIHSIAIEGEKPITSKVFKIISHFSELKSLHIRNHPTFEVIPLEFFELVNLEYISFTSTKLKCIPSEIVNLKRLKGIDFSHNEILEINENIGKLSQLKSLNLEDNKIKNISLDMLHLLLEMKLNHFSLYKNPILSNDLNFYNEELITHLIGEKKSLKRYEKSPKTKEKNIQKKSENRVKTVNQNLDIRPLIITEGKTDWKHFKSALNFFQKNEEFKDLNIDFFEYDDVDMGETKLEKRLKDDAQIPQSRMRIGIFDCDTKIGKKYEKKENQKLSENVYAISIPTPSFRQYHDGICVEFLYMDEDLKKKDSNGRRIFLSEEFSHRGRLLENREIVIENSSKIKNYIKKEKSKILDSEVIDKNDNNIALSKNDFAKNILESIAPFNKMDFEGFRGLFELLDEIISKHKISKNIKSDKLGNNSIFNYEKLTTDLIEIALIETKNRNTIFKESEDETNDRFRNALHYKKYNVTDQSRGGESSSGINAGERDLVIRNSRGLDESVIEAFILKSLDSTVINKHYEKLVKRYDTSGNRINFVLVYSKTKNFNELWNKYIKFDGFENFVDTHDEYSQKDNVRVGVSEYKKMKVYHLFINFYSQGQG